MIKILSWNVNGIRAIHRKDELLPLLKSGPDILCLQETKAKQEQLPNDLVDVKGYHSYFSSAEKKAILYDITKNVVGGGPLEPFMRDPNIEDIHILTGEDVHLIHKVFDMVRTNIHIDPKWAEKFSQ